ncbi:AAA family ATPase [Arsenicibacter rosenii]|uniref:AAA+ ATPase domain-containing protein n=1 Tax=Arsenicibacter rosenii TaxID=1750698 RepID=A0A1S2VHV0_9BACT|nr:AAA family ATPase [Arsenicibacter rosenii]OIN57815.1 hypothetical protein BLX24_17085 [Arsenicibacter rosenii]
MKITKVDIGDYRQFKNISFDFTYPEGHPKAGQPLDKVCLIGQSGTGKTTLLNVIWELTKTLSKVWEAEGRVINNDLLSNEKLLGELFEQTSFKLKVGYQIATLKKASAPNMSDREYLADWYQQYIHKKPTFYFNPNQKVCIYIKDSIAREADAFLFDQKEKPQLFSDFIKTTTQVENEKAEYENWINSAGSRKAIVLGDMESLSTWQYLLRDLNQYDEESQAIVRSFLQKQGASASKLVNELQKWIDTTPNPRIDLAEKCLNPILDKLFLEVDTAAGNVPITLQTKGGVKIPNDSLSTGTRQLLSTAIPLYKFNTKDTLILFDEPERSLFPDIQRELIKYYTGLAPEAQFFFATHSPIIAAAFEPCERFILYFDENGEVKCRNGVAPIGDDPNDVLRKDFNMSPLVPEEGVEAYQNYLDLATKIKNEPDIERKMALIAERSILGNKYDFPVTKADEKN